MTFAPLVVAALARTPIKYSFSKCILLLTWDKWSASLSKCVALCPVQYSALFLVAWSLYQMSIIPAIDCHLLTVLLNRRTMMFSRWKITPIFIIRVAYICAVCCWHKLIWSFLCVGYVPVGGWAVIVDNTQLAVDHAFAVAVVGHLSLWPT